MGETIRLNNLFKKNGGKVFEKFTVQIWGKIYWKKCTSKFVEKLDLYFFLIN